MCFFFRKSKWSIKQVKSMYVILYDIITEYNYSAWFCFPILPSSAPFCHFRSPSRKVARSKSFGDSKAPPVVTHDFGVSSVTKQPKTLKGPWLKESLTWTLTVNPFFGKTWKEQSFRKRPKSVTVPCLDVGRDEATMARPRQLKASDRWPTKAQLGRHILWQVFAPEAASCLWALCRSWGRSKQKKLELFLNKM